MIIMIYKREGFKTYSFSDRNDTDIDIYLDKVLFGLSKDITLKFDITNQHYYFKKNDEYEVFYQGEVVREQMIQAECVYEVVTKDNDRFQLIAAFNDRAFYIYEKVSIGTLSQITIGQEKGNMIVYRFMELISKDHGSLRQYKDGVYVEDRSANGIFVNGMRCKKRQKLTFGDSVRIFGLNILYLGTVLGIAADAGELFVDKNFLKEADLKSVEENQKKENAVNIPSFFNRAPRHMPAVFTDSVEIESAPEVNIMGRRPMILMIGPALTMTVPMLMGCMMAIAGSRRSGQTSGIFMYTGIVTSIGAAALGVLWAVLNVSYTKKEEKKKQRKRLDAYETYLEERITLLEKHYTNNTQALLAMYPSAKICCQYTSGSAMLWNRNDTHKDYLYERLGIGDIPFQVDIQVPKEKFSIADDALRKRPAEILAQFDTLKAVPIGINLSEHHLVGIVAEKVKHQAYSILYSIAAQIAVNNCYTDVKMVFMYDAYSEREHTRWQFARWLPHVWSGDKSIRYVAENIKDIKEISDELSVIFQERSKNSMRNNHMPKPYYIIFISDTVLLDGQSLKKYLYEPKDNYGVSTLVIADCYEKLPNTCEYIIENDHDFCGMYHVMDSWECRQKVQFDHIEMNMLNDLAYRLSNICVRDIEDDSIMPEHIGFFEMYGVHSLEEFCVIERWRKNRTDRTMKVLIGKKDKDMGCYLDAHEKYHGPHGLIAGTTGSGKSETLQTYILSLAINFSPEDIQFFIIDFKGGGMANLFNGLPHMAGQITNLSGNQIQRAMTSIKSENVRRQKMLSSCGVNHINDYTRLYKNQKIEVPLPHLFIIIDEFAELKREKPEFMRKLVSVAQVGRSLGVHLILATQKPSGTVDDNIWSNSKFRLCLRVQDRQDSQDMLHKPDAAYITQPGRCYLQVGNDEIYEQFQSGWSGGIYNSYMNTKREETAAMLTSTGRAVVSRKQNHKEQEKLRLVSENKNPVQTQLEVIVKYLANLSRVHGYTYRMNLWLPVLPKYLYLNQIQMKKKEMGVEESVWELVADVGLADQPQKQKQIPLTVDFSSKGHCIVCGSVVSGKSTFLQTLIYALVNKYSSEYLHMYILDFSSHMLLAFSKSPHVGGVICERDLDQVKNLFHMIGEMIKKRRELFQGGSYQQYIRLHGSIVPSILLFIDNYASFKEKTDNSFEEALLLISREGMRLGIFLVIASNGFSALDIPSRIGDNIKQVIALDMGDRYKMMAVLRINHLAVLPEKNIKGRGLCVIDDECLEFQTALALKTKDDYERQMQIAESCQRMNKEKRAPEIPHIPKNSVSDEFFKLEECQRIFKRKEALPYGYNMEDASIYTVSLNSSYCYMITGGKRVGKSNVLKVMIDSALRLGSDVTVIEAGTKEIGYLSDDWKFVYLHTDIEIFKFMQQLAPVFGERNQQKHRFQEQGLNEDEIYIEMHKTKMYMIFITDILSFFQRVYTSGEGQGTMGAFMENILEKGYLHNIYFFGCMDSADYVNGMCYKGFQIFTGYKMGIHLGGYLGMQTVFSFSNIPYNELNKAMKKGIGVTPSKKDCNVADTVVIPWFRGRQSAAKVHK